MTSAGGSQTTTVPSSGGGVSVAPLFLTASRLVGVCDKNSRLPTRMFLGPLDSSPSVSPEFPETLPQERDDADETSPSNAKSPMPNGFRVFPLNVPCNAVPLSAIALRGGIGICRENVEEKLT